MIPLEDFAFIVETRKAFDETVISVLKAVDSKGWAVFQIYDLKERLAAKGFNQKPLKIIEICSAKYANQFLDKVRMTSLCLPCRIIVLEDQGKIKIAAMRPTMISQLFPEITLDETLEAEKALKEIIDNAR